MDRPAVSDATQGAYDRIAEDLVVEAGSKAGQMMGMPTLFLDGKAPRVQRMAQPRNMGS